MQRIVGKLVRTDSLTGASPTERSQHFGNDTGDPVHLPIKRQRAENAITFNPIFALPEVYMDGDVDIVGRDVFGLIWVFFQNLGNAASIRPRPRPSTI